jgi:hypothetical protein
VIDTTPDAADPFANARIVSVEYDDMDPERYSEGIFIGLVVKQLQDRMKVVFALRNGRDRNRLAEPTRTRPLDRQDLACHRGRGGRERIAARSIPQKSLARTIGADTRTRRRIVGLPRPNPASVHIGESQPPRQRSITRESAPVPVPLAPLAGVPPW